MDSSVLENLGLTRAEIKVFVTLLELGSSTAGKIVEKSGLQNAVVHRAFHSLTEKGLITYVFEGRIKHYQPIEPKLLLNFLDEKRAKLEKLLPELEARRNKQKEKPRAMIFEGQRGIKGLLSLLLADNSKEYFSYGGAQKSDEILGTAFWENFHRKRIARRIKAKLLFHSSLKWWGNRLKKFNLTNVKFTNKDFEELTETIICGNKTGIIVWADKPFGFLIEEELVTKSYKKFFDILWKIAKP